MQNNEIKSLIGAYQFYIAILRREYFSLAEKPENVWFVLNLILVL